MMRKNLVSLGLAIFILGVLDQLGPMPAADRVVDTIAIGLSLIIIVLGLSGRRRTPVSLSSTRVKPDRIRQNAANDLSDVSEL